MLETFISALLSTTMLVNGVDGRCVSNSAKYYDIPPSVILAIMTVEGGKIGSSSKNKNGSYDLGPMQINTLWLKETKLKASSLQYNGCTNVFTGAWILKKSITEKGSLWGGIARYHSKTPKYYQKYIKKVYAARKEILIKFSKLMREQEIAKRSKKSNLRISVRYGNHKIEGKSKMRLLQRSNKKLLASSFND